MEERQVNSLLTDAGTLREILGTYDMGYCIGVGNYSNDEGNPELILNIEGDSDGEITKKIVRFGKPIKIIVKTGFIPLEALGK